MKNVIQLVLIVSLFANVNCGGSRSKSSGENKDSSNNKMEAKKDNANTTAPEKMEKDAGANTGQKYGIPSAMINFEQSMSTGGMSLKTTQVLCFNDFGNMERRETSMTNPVNGIVTVNSIIIIRDGYMYSYNPMTKTGTKSKLTGKYSGKEVSMMDVEKMKKDYKYTELSDETVCGKKCKVMEVEMANGKEKVYTWNRVTLRMEMQDPASKAAIDLKAVKVDENTNIPPEKFDVPTEVKFVEH